MWGGGDAGQTGDTKAEPTTEAAKQMGRDQKWEEEAKLERREKKRLLVKHTNAISRERHPRHHD
jgi:hypothetical protein